MRDNRAIKTKLRLGYDERYSSEKSVVRFFKRGKLLVLQWEQIWDFPYRSNRRDSPRFLRWYTNTRIK